MTFDELVKAAENHTFTEEDAIKLRKELKELKEQFDREEESRRVTQKDLDFVYNL